MGSSSSATVDLTTVSWTTSNSWKATRTLATRPDWPPLTIWSSTGSRPGDRPTGGGGAWVAPPDTTLGLDKDGLAADRLGEVAALAQHQGDPLVFPGWR